MAHLCTNVLTQLLDWACLYQQSSLDRLDLQSNHGRARGCLMYLCLHQILYRVISLLEALYLPALLSFPGERKRWTTPFQLFLLSISISCTFWTMRCRGLGMCSWGRNSLCPFSYWPLTCHQWPRDTHDEVAKATAVLRLNHVRRWHPNALPSTRPRWRDLLSGILHFLKEVQRILHPAAPPLLFLWATSMGRSQILFLPTAGEAPCSGGRDNGKTIRNLAKKKLDGIGQAAQ